jgi:hypothetical protein
MSQVPSGVAVLEPPAPVVETSPEVARQQVPTLLVRKGKTNRAEYQLRGDVIVVGKAPAATVKIQGWLAPMTAAQINRRADRSYYISAAEKVPSVNGYRIAHPTQLAPGDIIEIAGIELEFVYRD